MCSRGSWSYSAHTSGKKTTVPTGSRWFGEAYEHPQWYLSESIALSMATQTASPLSPTTIPDVNWVEKALLEPVITTVCNDLRQNRGEDAYVTLAALHPLFQRFGTQLDAQAAIGWVMKLSDRALEAIATAPQHVPEPERNLVSRVASIDMLAGLTVGLEVGLYRRLSDLDVATLTTTLTSTRWERDDAPYKVRMPRPVVETLEELQAGIKFESEAQADVRTPNWYVAEIARNRLAWCAQAEFDACLTHVETWYSQTAPSIRDEAAPSGRGCFGSGGGARLEARATSRLPVDGGAPLGRGGSARRPQSPRLGLASDRRARQGVPAGHPYPDGWIDPRARRRTEGE